MDIKQINNALNARQSDSLRRPDAARGEAAAHRRNEASNGVQEKVSIDSLSAQAAALQDQAVQADTDNRARIEQLKQAIADGTYEVDARAVAKKLMQTEALFATL